MNEPLTTIITAHVRTTIYMGTHAITRDVPLVVDESTTLAEIIAQAEGQKSYDKLRHVDIRWEVTE